MLYYRIAWKNNAAAWEWKSTKLSSLDALFRFLRMYGALAQDRLRIFSASSIEGLNEQLRRKNSGLTNASLSVKEFLLDQSIKTVGIVEADWEREAAEAAKAVGSASVPSDPLADERRVRGRAFSDQGFNEMDRRRIVRELGRGGDHDALYTFTLPVSLPQVLAWTTLLAKVERGELGS